MSYPGLESSPWHARQLKYSPKRRRADRRVRDQGRGGGRLRRFTDALELFTNLANIGDVRSLVIHPASTTHAQLSSAEQLTTGSRQG